MSSGIHSVMPLLEEHLQRPDTLALLDDARRGDTQAFCQLVQPLEARLLQQAIALCRDASAAEDLVSETLVQNFRTPLTSRWNEWLWPSPAAWGALAAVWVCLLSIHWSLAIPPSTSREVPRRSPGRTAVEFAQRQRELASLLESLSHPVATPPPERPRPGARRCSGLVAV